MFETRSERAFAAVAFWPFELPQVWRRAFLIAFPITVPIWLAGVLLLGYPLLLWTVLSEAVAEVWNGEKN